MQATFTVVMKQGDPTYQEALARVRRDVIKQVIGPGADLDLLYAFETKVVGQVDDVRVDYEPRQDKEPPKLDTNSTPRKGTKVKAGDRIKVTMIARDNANRWQTGIRAIQRVADSEGNRFVGAEHYAQTLPRCAATPPEKRLEATYTVPANPPPIVRLEALAEDYVGLMDTDVGEFPTGDWYGTIKKTVEGGGFNYTVDLDLAFDIDTSGKIKGRAHGKVKTQEGQVPACTVLWTFTPSEFEMPLSGRRDGADFVITLEPGPATATNRQTCTYASPSITLQLSPITAHAHTIYRVSAEDGGKQRVSSCIPGRSPWELVTEDSIEIHQARQ